MDTFGLAVIGILALLLIASGALLLAERLKFPFTILLFIIGFGLYLLGQFVPGVEALFSIKLSPDIIFYIFLPTLLFESSYKMSYRRLLKDSGPIFVLAVFGLIISALVIAGLGYLVFNHVIGIAVPVLALLIFGAIISATDPVAVLAIFKEFGVPKRLEMLFDGESVFNDGTALALFLVLVEIARSGVLSAGSIAVGIATFASMLVLGIVYGALTGTVASKLIEKVRNNSAIEITVMMALAHLTFISAELISHFVSEHGGALSFLRISPVIATAISAVMLGNYGRYKISPPVLKAMDLYWGYFAFVCNALIFLMMGYVIGTIDVPWGALWLPVLAMIAIVVLARAVSIYGSVLPMNLFLKHKIPLIWQHLMAYGSLRGGLALAMIMLLPADMMIAGWTLPYTPTNFIAALVLGCIIFTLIVKATTFGAFMRFFRVGEYSQEERFTDLELRSFIGSTVIRELDRLRDEKFLRPESHAAVVAQYGALSEAARGTLTTVMQTADFKAHVTDIVARYALGIEKYAVEHLYACGEVTERAVRTVINQIEGQYARLEHGDEQVKPTGSHVPLIRRTLEWIDTRFLASDYERLRDKYLYHLAREKMCLIVQHDLAELEHDLGDDSKLAQAFADVQLRYTEWHSLAVRKRLEIAHDEPELIAEIDRELAQTIACTTARHTLEHLHEHEIVPEKVHGELEKLFAHGAEHEAAAPATEPAPAK